MPFLRRPHNHSLITLNIMPIKSISARVSYFQHLFPVFYQIYKSYLYITYKPGFSLVFLYSIRGDRKREKEESYWEHLLENWSLKVNRASKSITIHKNMSL